MIAKLALFMLLTLNTNALEFKIIGACSTTPLFETQVNGTFNNVGELSHTVLKEYNIQNLASDYGISQIFNSPVGDIALEVISDYKLRAHGWCYSVDGNVPEVLMGDFNLLGNEKEITWFMGYTTYIGYPETGESEWVGQCTPSNLPPANPVWCNNN
ncbi:hypothetical protein A9Q84_06410 [Halobacteriovorax marinus]|uniref:DUF4430 domain-containing protein n=1 Tax=Halobacteriovorax marinus TaxID=97084 RepID=A0A1Y5F9W8_9BACT|nr:hypothetical protein A9Q84_06410 [Halobacteriovorax marinus]